MRVLFSLIAVGGAAAVSTSATSTPVEPVAAITAVHCQVPCGIYGDKMRIDMLLEDAATIEKAMNSISAADTSKNQSVRWVMNKESHAQNIQDMVAAYWLSQRIKAPKEKVEGAVAKYQAQLAAMHQLTVAAMKCKQTTDTAHVATLRRVAADFSATYFSADDLKHLREHSFSHGK
jgi:nickel superoxide dismutase